MLVVRYTVLEIQPHANGAEYREIRRFAILDRAYQFAKKWSDCHSVATSIDMDVWEINRQGRQTVESVASVSGYRPAWVCPHCYRVTTRNMIGKHYLCGYCDWAWDN